MCFEKFNSISQISNIENSNFLNYDSIGLISDKNNKIIELNEQIHEENKQLVKLQNNTLKKTIKNLKDLVVEFHQFNNKSLISLTYDNFDNFFQKKSHNICSYNFFFKKKTVDEFIIRYFYMYAFKQKNKKIFKYY